MSVAKHHVWNKMADVEQPLVSTAKLQGAIVRPRSSRPPRDHLTATKTFTQLQRNGIVGVHPHVVTFEGFRVGSTHHTTLRITNESREPQRMHIIPPNSTEFKINYLKKGSLFPGLHLDVKVSFVPKEWRYHHDCILLHCSEDRTLIVPLHAFPIANVSKVPKQITFPSTALGKSSSKFFSISSDGNVDFQYRVTEPTHHPAFSVQPCQGLIPGRGSVTIKVTYTPTDYTTALTQLQLDVSQFNWTPLMCTLVGTSTPGLALKHHKAGEGEGGAVLGPLERLKDQRMRKKGQTSCKPSTVKAVNPPAEKAKEVVLQGYRVPADLNNPTAVARVLSQEPGKLRAAELRGAVDSLGHLAQRQQREAAYLQVVRERQAEEQACQYKWTTKLGGKPLSDEERQSVLAARQAEQQGHQSGQSQDLEGFTHSTRAVFERIVRTVGESPGLEPTFEDDDPDNWASRRATLLHFAGAARKVLTRRRCEKRLRMLQCIPSTGAPPAAPPGTIEEQSAMDVLPLASHTKIVPFSFPHENGSGSENTMSSEPLGKVTVELPDHAASRRPPLLELQVPQEYKLLGYQPHPLPPPDSYAAPGLLRPLRTGAREEVEAVGLPPSVQGGSPVGIWPLIVGQSLDGGEMCVTDLEEGEGEKEEVEGSAPLLPPATLFDTPNYPPFHIFVPCVGVQTAFAPSPYSEGGLERHLLPLQCYPTDKPFVQETCVIPGVMDWEEDRSVFLSVAKRGRPSVAAVGVARTTADSTSESRAAQQAHFMQDCVPRGLPPLLPAPLDQEHQHKQSQLAEVPAFGDLGKFFNVPDLPKPVPSEPPMSLRMEEDQPRLCSSVCSAWRTVDALQLQQLLSSHRSTAL